MPDVTQGTVFGQRYLVQSQVGTGGMATVYRGVDTVLDRAVAIKVMLPQYANDPTFAARFKQEAKAAAALQSPYIVSVYDWGRDVITGTYYIVMEYLRGTDLKTGIRSHGALAPRKVAQIGAQVCHALSVAHAHDIIHRDIKPQNIMIQPNGDAKVMDFGIARAGNSHLTQTNSVLGTAHYVSPEQAQGKDLGPTSDLYSLGVVMYEAATGRLPFDGDDAVSVALKQVNEQPVPPRQINPAIDPDLERIILTCMAKNPSQRFQSADDLRRVLNAYIMGQPINLPAPIMNSGVTTRLGADPTSVQQPSPISSPISNQVIAPVSIDRTRVQPRQNSHYAAVGYQSPYQATGRIQTGSHRAQKQNDSLPPLALVGIVLLLGIIVVGLVWFATNNLRSCSLIEDPIGIVDPGGSGTTTTNPSGTGQTVPSPSGQGTTTTNPADVPVPDVSGLSQQEARNKLESYGLKLGPVTEAASPTVPATKVISQSPVAKTQVPAGSSVSIVISTGSDKIPIPSLLRLTEMQAYEVLGNAGLGGYWDYTLDTYDDEIPEGLVCTYTPANQKVAPRTLITFGLSKGPESVKVPDVTGKKYEVAKEELMKSFSIIRMDVFDKSVPEGSVIKTSPAKDEKAPKGSEVTVYVSKGKEKVTVMDYTGRPVTAVQAELTAKGITVTVDTKGEATDPSKVGQVYHQSKTSGTTLYAGDSITLYAYGGEAKGTVPNDILAGNPTLSEVVEKLTRSGFTDIAAFDADGFSIPVARYGDYTAVSISSMGSLPLSTYLRLVGKPVTFKVGSYVGKTSEAAQAEIQSAGGFAQVAVGFDAPDASQEGLVYSQNPEAGTDVEKGGVVFLAIYGAYKPPAPVTITVGDYTGQSPSAAAAAIEAAGAKASPVLGIPAPDATQAGLVYNQDPLPYNEISAGSTVTIFYYGDYVAPATFLVGNYVDWPYTSAASSIAEAGGVANPIPGVAAPNGLLSGVVYDQDPDPNFEVIVGSTVTIYYYSEYVPPVTPTFVVDNYYGWNSASAEAAIQSAGGIPNIVIEVAATDADQEGLVYAQYPEANTVVEEGSYVTIYVYGPYIEPEPEPEIEPEIEPEPEPEPEP